MKNMIEGVFKKAPPKIETTSISYRSGPSEKEKERIREKDKRLVVEGLKLLASVKKDGTPEWRHEMAVGIRMIGGEEKVIAHLLAIQKSDWAEPFFSEEVGRSSDPEKVHAEVRKNLEKYYEYLERAGVKEEEVISNLEKLSPLEEERLLVRSRDYDFFSEPVKDFIEDLPLSKAGAEKIKSEGGYRNTSLGKKIQYMFLAGQAKNRHDDFGIILPKKKRRGQV